MASRAASSSPPQLAPSRLRVLLVAGLAALTLLATILLMHGLKQRHNQLLSHHFTNDTDRITAKIGWRMSAYTQILRGGAGLFAASDEVSREQWKRYVEKLNLDQTYRGIQGVGFTRHIRPDELEAHEKAVQAQGYPAYQVNPSGERDIYTSILYLEPFSGRNLRAFGFDMYSEAVRREAMAAARDTGGVVFTGKVQLVQETDSDVQAGILAYHPVYANGAFPATLEQRRETLIGWTYSPYRMNDLIEAMLRSDLAAMRLQIFDGVHPAADTLLYDSHPQGSETAALSRTTRLSLSGREWTLRFTSLPGFAASTKYEEPWMLYIGLALIGMLTFGLSYALLNTRRRAESIARDLTGSLLESQQHFQAIFEQAAVGIALQEPHSSRYLRVNRRFCELLGYSQEELQQMRSEDLCDPEHLSLEHAQKLRLNAGEISHFSLEKRYRTKAGSFIWASVSGSAMTVDGRITYHLLMIEDVSQRKEYQAALADSEGRARELSERLGQVIWATRSGTWQWSPRTGALQINARWAQMLGYQIEELQPLTYQTWLSLVNPADLLQAEQRLHDCLQGRTEHYENELRMRHRDGHWAWIHTCGQVVEWADGAPALMSGTHTDISARKHNEEKLRLAASVFTHARESIMITNAAGEIVDVNATFTLSTGYSREEVLGRNPRMLKSGRHPDSFYEELWRTLAAQDYWCGEVWNRNRDGGVRASLLTISAVRDSAGEIGHYVSLITDISAMKEQVAALEHSANYDPLTGLPNRLLLADRLQQAISQAERRASQLAVVFLDLDGFKAVNDAHGHDIGDELLILLAERMKAVLRESDTLARLGGDEFIAILGDLQQPLDCLPILERLLVLAAEPVLVRGIELQVSVSIGVSLFPSDARSAQLLVRHADQAMYDAKQAGRNAYRFFASPTTQTDPIDA